MTKGLVATVMAFAALAPADRVAIDAVLAGHAATLAAWGYGPSATAGG